MIAGKKSTMKPKTKPWLAASQVRPTRVNAKTDPTRVTPKRRLRIFDVDGKARERTSL